MYKSPHVLQYLNPIQSFFLKYEQSLCAFYLEVSQIHANVTDGLIMKNVLQSELRHLFLPPAISVQSRY